MKVMARMLVVALVGAGVVMGGVAPALCADDQGLCAMGGTLIQVKVDKDKVADWADRERKKTVVTEDPWTLTTMGEGSDDIALVFTKEYVFFGVAGKDDRAVDERIAEKAFGNNFRILKETVKKTMGELKRRNSVDIDGSDVQALADAAGLGTLAKDGRDWKLATSSCEGKSVNVSDLK
jgi:hypothetical protein